MHHNTPLISTVVVGLVLAFILGALAQRVRVSPLVGYLVAGVLMGPFTPGYVADQGKKQLGSGVVAFVATSEDGKASVVVGVTSDLTERFSAVDLVRKASETLGGKGGGGRPDMAQAGGPDGAKADAALKAIESAIAG